MYGWKHAMLHLSQQVQKKRKESSWHRADLRALCGQNNHYRLPTLGGGESAPSSLGHLFHRNPLNHNKRLQLTLVTSHHSGNNRVWKLCCFPCKCIKLCVHQSRHLATCSLCRCVCSYRPKKATVLVTIPLPWQTHKRPILFPFH